MSKTWKSVEARIAEFFGLRRVPLSGSMSRHGTRFDAVLERGGRLVEAPLCLEVKHSKRFPKRRAEYLRLARREGKPLVLAEHRAGERGFWIVIHSSDFDRVVRAYLDLKLKKEENSL